MAEEDTEYFELFLSFCTVFRYADCGVIDDMFTQVFLGCKENIIS